MRLRGPRITSVESHSALDRIMARWPMRYGSASLVAALLALGELLARHSVPNDALALAAFGAILLVSVFAGFGAALWTTFLSLAIARLIPVHPFYATDLFLLGMQGLLLAIVGGAFRATRIKAGERLAANLRLEQQIIEIGDDERRRIGHDLHDGLGQHLTGISLLSETISQQLEAGKQPERSTVETITRLVSEAVRITRDLARSLSPVTLERDGLLAAIEELSDTAAAIFSIDCRWEFDRDEFEVERTRALHLYRIVQEAVNNSVRHGKARNVRIGLIHDGPRIRITITDDGSGLSHKTMENPGLGLRIMQYRARMLGAALSVERATEAGGTVVTCTCPIDADSSAK